MTILKRATSPAPRDSWWRIHGSDPDALVTQSPAWLDCVCETAGFADASRLYELEDGRELVLPMVRRRHVPARFAVAMSLPSGWGVAGLVGTGAGDPATIQTVLHDLRNCPELSVRVAPHPLHVDCWTLARTLGAVAVPRMVQSLSLAAGFAQLERRFDRAVRRGLRKAEESGLQVERSTSGELISEFYQLFQKSTWRWARQQRRPRLLSLAQKTTRDPKHKFAKLAATLGQACHVWLARLQGEPAAALIVLKGANAQYIRGAMDKELANLSGANFLLHYLAIRDACESGCRFYHMGESGTNASLARFKRHFGAESYPCAEYRLERVPLTAIDRACRSWLRKAITPPLRSG